MNNITDDQLRALLAKMLPLAITQHACGKYYWIGSANGFVLDTELLHIVSFVEVESGLNSYPLREKYLYKLMDIVKEDGRDTLVIFATWQQRTRALAEVKGVTL